jgi:hypothetical protein
MQESNCKTAQRALEGLEGILMRRRNQPCDSSFDSGSRPRDFVEVRNQNYTSEMKSE